MRSSDCLTRLRGDCDEAKVVELENLRWSAVELQLFFERGHNLVAVLTFVHVDEVDDDDAAEIPQTNLANDLRNGVEVRFYDRIFEASGLAHELAGVDIDGDEGFCLIDDNRATGLEPDLRAQSLIDLFGDAELLEERRFLGIELDAADERRLEALQEAQHALVLGLGINPDSGEGISDLVAQDALDEI